MKQTRLMKMLFVPAALSFFAACSSDNDIVGDKNSTEDKGVTLTINANAGSDAAMSRVQYNNDYSVEWTSADKVYAFAGSTANAGLCGITTTADKHNAKLTVKLNSTPTSPTEITAYVANKSISAIKNGADATDGIGDQVKVDYSNQAGTYEDATNRCVLFGKTTYDPAKGTDLSMNFEYQTTFLKLTLNFPETTVAGTAALYLTGDNVYSISRMNTTGSNAGKLGNQNGFTITVPSVNVAAGKAENIYIALYPGAVQNVKLQAVMADGKTYEFTLGNANLAAGKVYNIAKTGTKVATEAATKFASGDGKKTPFVISNLAELNYLRKLVKNEILLSGKTNNYGLAGYKIELAKDIIINGDWEPIGTNSAPFRGDFNGNGHSIIGSVNVTVNTANDGAGFFGNVGEGCKISNLINKANYNISTTNGEKGAYSGAIVGRIIKHSTIQNCVNKGIVVSQSDNVGGLVGNIYLPAVTEAKAVDYVIEACVNEGIIKNTKATSDNVSVAGIVGSVNLNTNSYENVIITGCYAKGFSIYAQKKTKLYAGGLVGRVVGERDNTQLKMISCWSSDIVYPNPDYLGGIIGTYSASKFTIDHCWTNASQLNVTTAKPNFVVTNSYNSKQQPNLSNMIEGMNTAWQTTISGTTFKFDATGAIVTNK